MDQCTGESSANPTTGGRSRRSRLVAALVGACALLGAALPAHATHFRYGNLSWQFVAGRTVEFRLTDAFRRTNTPSFDPCVSPSNTNTIVPCTGPGGLHGVGDLIREDIGGSQLQFGDGITAPTGSTPLAYVVTSIDTINQWSFVEAVDPSSLPAIDTTISHTYGGAATSFTAMLDDCCRISPAVAPNGHINNPDKGYTLSTTVLFTGDNAPVSTQVPIVTCPYPAVCTFFVPASDPDGDTLRWRLATATEANSANTGGTFVQPGPPNATNAASVNPSTGLYTWNTTGATLAGAGLNTLYSTQVIIEELDGLGNVKSRTPVDWLIQLVPLVNNPPTCNVSSPHTVLAGNNLAFTASGSDVDLGDTITLNAAGLPVGSTMTPPLPTNAVSPATVSSNFSWTPTQAQVGVYVIQYSVIDQANQQSLCSTTITVQCNSALCGDGNDCTDNACDSPSGMCVSTNNSASCDDGNACTQTDTCSGGSCSGANPVICTNGDQCNTAGTCQAGTGLCSPPVPHGGACDDTSLCTTGDTCQSGTCVGTPVVCTGDQCNTAGTCQAETGLCSPPVPHGGACNDTSLCTTGDTCQSGTCVGTPVVCTGDQCNTPGTCQVGTGLCSPPAPHGGVCNDGNAGSCDDECVSGICLGAVCTPEICADQIDNDGDGLIDCLDTVDCPCPPIIDTCNHPCISQIVFMPRGLDLLRFQASFKPLTAVDPATEQVGVLITNANGIVFADLLPAGTLVRAGKSFARTIKAGKTTGGIYKIKITPLVDGSYRVNVKGYKEMSTTATLPSMDVQLLIGDDVAVSTSNWLTVKSGWRVQLP